MPTTYDAINAVTVQFALVLALSFVIERILEIGKAVYDIADGRFNWYRDWTALTYRTRSFIERRLRVFNHVDKAAAAAVLSRFDAMLLGRTAAEKPVVPVLCGDLVRAIWCRATLKYLGATIGIGLAFTFHLDLVALIEHSPGDPLPPVTFVGQLATGLSIGLGSGIVHKLITSIERKQRRNEEATNAA